MPIAVESSLLTVLVWGLKAEDPKGKDPTASGPGAGRETADVRLMFIRFGQLRVHTENLGTMAWRTLRRSHCLAFGLSDYVDAFLLLTRFRRDS